MTKSFLAQLWINGDEISEDSDNLFCAKARNFRQSQADAILITDVSSSEPGHDYAVAVIKQIAGTAGIPVIAAGRVARTEDVKKYLYAGARAVVMDFSQNQDLAFLKEVSMRFGKNKIYMRANSPGIISECRIEFADYCDTLVLDDYKILKECAGINVPKTLVCLPELPLNKILSYLTNDSVRGIFGNAVDKNLGELDSIKRLCAQHGVKVHLQEDDKALVFRNFKLNSDGLIPVITSDYRTGEVLMLAYANEEAFRATIATGRMHYYPRSRNKLWMKGEESGNFQYVKEIAADCDFDTLLVKVEQIGPACHTGNRSCFFNRVYLAENTKPVMRNVLEKISYVIKERKEHPKEGSYTNYLFDKGLDKILKKIGEECSEIIIAAKNPNPEEVKYEISDFLYHMMVLMEEKGVSWDAVYEELARR